MIQAVIAEQIRYLDRCVNPDYLIIIRNKAGQEMDFSQFKIMGLDEEVTIPRYREFTASCDPVQGEEGKLRIIVSENLGNTCVMHMICKEEKVDVWKAKFKKDYGIKVFTTKPVINYESFGD